MPKRGDRVAPPPEPDGWDWEQLGKHAPGPTRRAYFDIVEDPVPAVFTARRHPLKDVLGARTLGGRALPQWQVTGGGRVWYAVDATAMIV